MRFQLSVNGVEGLGETLHYGEGRQADSFTRLLPIADHPILPSCWSGSACEADLSATGAEWDLRLDLPCCSAYPGTLVLLPQKRLLVISYGTTELRDATGVIYGSVVGRVVDNRKAVLSALASSHDVGQLSLSIGAA